MSISQKNELYILHNEYILFCDFINKTPNAHIKLELDTVNDLIINYIRRPPSRKNVLYQYLMGLQMNLSRLGGGRWWNECKWNSVVFDLARHNHSILLLTYNLHERRVFTTK